MVPMTTLTTIIVTIIITMMKVMMVMTMMTMMTMMMMMMMMMTTCSHALLLARVTARGPQLKTPTLLTWRSDRDVFGSLSFCCLLSILFYVSFYAFANSHSCVSSEQIWGRPTYQAAQSGCSLSDRWTDSVLKVSEMWKEKWLHRQDGK